jgi:hypothetical protein
MPNCCSVDAEAVPPVKGGAEERGGGFLSDLFILKIVNESIDLKQHLVHVLPYFMFREPQKVQSLLLQNLLSLGIIHGNFLEMMASTIHFNYKIQFLAIQIHNVIAQWFLAVELVTSHLSTLQLNP